MPTWGTIISDKENFHRDTVSTTSHIQERVYPSLRQKLILMGQECGRRQIDGAWTRGWRWLRELVMDLKSPDPNYRFSIPLEIDQPRDLYNGSWWEQFWRMIPADKRARWRLLVVISGLSKKGCPEIDQTPKKNVYWPYIWLNLILVSQRLFRGAIDREIPRNL